MLCGEKQRYKMDEDQLMGLVWLDLLIFPEKLEIWISNVNLRYRI